MRLSVFATAVLMLPFTVIASDNAESEAFTGLFLQTCMKHFYSQDELRREMSSKNAPVLQGEPSSFFLGNKPGMAWSVQVSDDSYVVSLRDDNVCAVFAQHAPIAEVQSNFTAMVAVAPEPLEAAPRDDAGPNSETLKTVSYSWSRPKDKVELVFTLTTSNEASPTVQAMASMALANKPNSSFKGKPLRGSP